MGNYRSILVLALAGTLFLGTTDSVALVQVSGIDHYRARLGYQNPGQQQAAPQRRQVQRQQVQRHAPRRQQQTTTERYSQSVRQLQRQPTQRSASNVRPTTYQLPVKTNGSPFRGNPNSRFGRPSETFSLPRVNSSRGVVASPAATKVPRHTGKVRRQLQDMFGEDQVESKSPEENAFGQGRVPERAEKPDVFGELQVPTRSKQTPAPDPDVFGEGQVPGQIPSLPDDPGQIPSLPDDPGRTPERPTDIVMPDAEEPNGVVLPPDALKEPKFLDNKNDVPGIIPKKTIPRPDSIFDNDPKTDVPELDDGDDQDNDDKGDDVGSKELEPDDIYDPADPRHPNANNGPESWYNPESRRSWNSSPGAYNPHLFGSNTTPRPGYAPPYPGYTPGYAPPHPGYAQQYPGYPPQYPGYAPQHPGYAQQYPGYPQQHPGYALGQVPPGYPPQPGTAPQHPGYASGQVAPGYPPQPGYAPPSYGQPANAGQYCQTSNVGQNYTDVTSSLSGCGGVVGCPDPCSNTCGGFGNGIVNGFMESTFYLSLFGGYTNLTPATLSDATGDFRVDANDGYNLGVALGQYQGLNLRTEIEFSFRENDLTSLTSPSDPSFVSPAFENAGIRSYAGMVNAVWEFIEFPSARVKPYIGAGFGFVNVDARAGLAGMDALAAVDSSDSSFGYQVIAGLNFQANETLDLFAEYRYLKADSLQLGNFGFDYETSNVFGGLRIKF